MVEKVIGHYLPAEALVHHVDGIKDHNVNDNFVICQDNSYHRLIEERTTAFRACGDVHKRKCDICHEYDFRENMTPVGRGAHNHKSCHTMKERWRREQWRKHD